MVATSIIIAACIYALYNAMALAFFGVPRSLSDTYYLYEKRSGKGWLFCVMMYMVVLFIMPAWISMSEGSPYQFLSFLAPVGILFVGTAPRFKESSVENSVHEVSAIFAAACSLLWVGLVTPYWWVILLWSGFVALASVLTSSYRSCLIFWLETVAFCATFTATIIYSCR